MYRNILDDKIFLFLLGVATGLALGIILNAIVFQS